MNLLTSLVLLVCLAAVGCKSTQVPQEGHRKAWEEAKSSAGISTTLLDSLKLAHQAGPDSLTFFMKVVQVHQTDCPDLERKNQELHKKKNTWKIISGVLFALATGHLAKVATD